MSVTCPPTQLALPCCQRWTTRRATYRPAGEPIDTSRYGVELLEHDRVARAFVQLHHYSGSYPAARLRVGLYRSGPARELVGIAVFSVPMSANALQKHCGTTAAVELGRFVLVDDVPANGETWFLARAFRVLRSTLPEVAAVLAYSDPVKRAGLDGTIILPGHIGTIYQAHNGRHTGRGAASTLWLTADGRTLSPRALSKIRNDERGRDYAEAQLVAAGAPARQPHEDARAWLDRALASGAFRRLRHPGTLAYAWPLAAGASLADAQPFPKAVAA